MESIVKIPVFLLGTLYISYGSREFKFSNASYLVTVQLKLTAWDPLEWSQNLGGQKFCPVYFEEILV